MAQGPADVINNVVYNVREGFVHHNPADGEFNIAGNYYKRGPSSPLIPLWFDPANVPTSSYFVDGNYVDDPGVYEGRVDNPFENSAYSDQYVFFCCGISPSHFDNDVLFNFSSYPNYELVTILPAGEAYDSVLARAGAWPRDLLNTWAVDEALNRTGTWGNRRPDDWMAGLSPTAAPPDLDGDGMSDQWELENDLDPKDGSDHSKVMPSGYTAIEVYINQIADGLVSSDLEQVFLDGFENQTTSAVRALVARSE